MRLASALLVLIVAVSGVPLFAQTPAASAWQPLDDQQSRYLRLAQDLNDIADPPTRPDAEVAIELSTIANTAGDHLSAGSDLLFLYDAITERGNRFTAQHMIRRRLQSYSKQLDISTTHINGILALIKSPGVAQTALRLRDELHNGSDLLKATVVK